MTFLTIVLSAMVVIVVALYIVFRPLVAEIRRHPVSVSGSE